MQYFINHEEMLSELEDKIFNLPKISRVGTGEFTDSLIWNYWTDLPEKLVNRFAGQDRAILELKTKTVAIDSLEKLDHNKKTIISWSINTPAIIRSDERKTSSLKSRLEAAAQCASWGYPLAFHFDPLFIYNGWENEYEQTINELFRYAPHKSVVYISLGSFRFMPSLKQTVQTRFPDSRIVYGEFIQGLDGKMRYFKPLRINLYKKIVSFIKKHAPDVCIYFCMEDDDVWDSVFGYVPEEPDGISDILDRSAACHCGVRNQIKNPE
jgi:spore photoproduct lyase